MTWRLPKRSLTWRAYRTTALAHFWIPNLNFVESSLERDLIPGSIDISMKEEKHRLYRGLFGVSGGTAMVVVVVEGGG